MLKISRKLHFELWKTLKKLTTYKKCNRYIKEKKQTQDCQGYRQSVHSRKSVVFSHGHHCKDGPSISALQGLSCFPV